MFGLELATSVFDDNLLLLRFRLFDSKKNYTLPKYSPKSGFNKAKIRQLNQFDGYYDSADINREEFDLMKNDHTVFLHDQTVCLWAQWFLCNPSSDEAQDVAIIPPFICKSVVDIIQKMSNPSFYNVELNRSLVSTFDKVDRYLYGHPQLLSKHSICIGC